MVKISVHKERRKQNIWLRFVLVFVGLTIIGYAIFKAFQRFHWTNFVLVPIGWILVIKGLNFHFSQESNLLIVIDSTRIEYDFDSTGDSSVILIQDLVAVNFDSEKRRFDFILKSGQTKSLFLAAIPKEKRIEVMEEIMRVSPR